MLSTDLVVLSSLDVSFFVKMVFVKKFSLVSQHPGFCIANCRFPHAIPAMKSSQNNNKIKVSAYKYFYTLKMNKIYIVRFKFKFKFKFKFDKF